MYVVKSLSMVFNFSLIFNFSSILSFFSNFIDYSCAYNFKLDQLKGLVLKRISCYNLNLAYFYKFYVFDFYCLIFVNSLLNKVVVNYYSTD